MKNIKLFFILMFFVFFISGQSFSFTLTSSPSNITPDYSSMRSNFISFQNPIIDFIDYTRLFLENILENMKIEFEIKIENDENSLSIILPEMTNIQLSKDLNLKGSTINVNFQTEIIGKNKVLKAVLTTPEGSSIEIFANEISVFNNIDNIELEGIRIIKSCIENSYLKISFFNAEGKLIEESILTNPSVKFSEEKNMNSQIEQKSTSNNLLNDAKKARLTEYDTEFDKPNTKETVINEIEKETANNSYNTQESVYILSKTSENKEAVPLNLKSPTPLEETPSEYEMINGQEPLSNIFGENQLKLNVPGQNSNLKEAVFQEKKNQEGNSQENTLSASLRLGGDFAESNSINSLSKNSSFVESFSGENSSKGETPMTEIYKSAVSSTTQPATSIDNSTKDILTGSYTSTSATVSSKQATPENNLIIVKKTAPQETAVPYSFTEEIIEKFKNNNLFAKKDSQELENDDEKKQENNENDRNSNPLIKYLSNDLKNIYLKETSVLYEDMPIIFNISDPENLALFIQKNYNIQISAEKILETLDAAALTAENTEILFSVVNVSDSGKIEGNLIAPNAGIVVDRAGNVITLKLQIASK